MSETLSIGGRSVTVRQLTMKQIREYMADAKDKRKLLLEWIKYEQQQAKMEDGTWKPDNPLPKPSKEYEQHVIDEMFDDEISAKALSIATGLSLDELAGEFSQAEIHELIQKVRAVNPFFVGMVERKVAAGRRLSTPSSEQSAA